MRERIRQFFDQLADRLFEGDLDWLADVYVYPMSVFIGDQIRVEATAEDTKTFLLQRRAVAAKRGVYGLSANVVHVWLKPNQDRFSVRMQFVFHGADGSEMARNTAHYRCCLSEDGDIRIESVELIEAGLPLDIAAVRARL